MDWKNFKKTHRLTVVQKGKTKSVDCHIYEIAVILVSLGEFDQVTIHPFVKQLRIFPDEEE